MKKAFLAFACVILAPLFLVSVSSSATYDPWADLDGDGDIDIYDVVKIAANYATTGDPGKNVSVTNWPSAHTVQQFAVNATWSGGRGGFVLHGLASGYSRMSLFIGPGSAKTTGSEYNITVWLRNILWTVYTPGGWPIDASQSVPKSFLNLTVMLNTKERREISRFWGRGICLRLNSPFTKTQKENSTP